MTRLEAKEDLNVLNDKKGEKMERTNEWMKNEWMKNEWEMGRRGSLFIDFLVTY